MDPQKLSQLDPKLRDAYQRVMGTAIPQSQPAPEPPQPEPTAPPPPDTQPIAPTQAPTDQQREPFFIPQPAGNPQSQVPPAGGPAPEPAIPAQPPAQPAPSQNFTVPPPMPQAQTVAVKKKSGMMPVLFGIVGLIFLVIYTLFWTKIFNFKLPFLP